MGWGLFWATLGIFAIWSAVLCVHDMRYRRLPNALTLPPALACLAASCVAPTLGWGMAWPALYLFAGRGIGGGDVKLAVPLGVVLAGLGGGVAVLAAIAVAGGLTAVLGLILGKTRLAHGPQMLTAAWIIGTFVSLNSSAEVVM